MDWITANSTIIVIILITTAGIDTDMLMMPAVWTGDNLLHDPHSVTPSFKWDERISPIRYMAVPIGLTKYSCNCSEPSERMNCSYGSNMTLLP